MKVLLIGLGGAGGNILNNIYEKSSDVFEYLYINSDKDSIENSIIKQKLYLELKQNQDNDIFLKKIRENILKYVNKADRVFVIVGLGGVTGSKFFYHLGRILKENKNFVIGIVTKPFKFEGKVRIELAENVLDNLNTLYDDIKIFENQSMFQYAKKETTFTEAFKEMDTRIRKYIENQI